MAGLRRTPWSGSANPALGFLTKLSPINREDTQARQHWEVNEGNRRWLLISLLGGFDVIGSQVSSL